MTLRQLLPVLLFLSAGLRAQQAATPVTDAQLTPEQQTQFAAAQVEFNGLHWDQAVAKLRPLHTAVPKDGLVAKFLAEAEVNASKPEDALQVLGPVLAANQEDVQALAIAARAYTQEHKAGERDATLAHLQRLHDSGATRLQTVILERTPTSNGGYVVFYHYLEPWSRYKIYEMARVYDSTGQQVWRVTLESADFDQVSFAKQHPDLAAKGIREFSMDGYSESAPNAQGVKTQTHATFGFFNGRPTYDEFHERTMNIAENKRAPISKSSGTPIPAKAQ